jgi:hypothetical protein
MKYFWKYGIPAYYNILNGAIFYNGSYSSVKVYDGIVPPNATSQPIYIVLSERFSNQTANKTMSQFDASLLIDIVAKTSGFGYKDTEDIANQILALINQNANPNTMPDFQVATTRVNTFNLQGINQTDNIFRTFIRFEHKVLQQ